MFQLESQLSMPSLAQVLVAAALEALWRGGVPQAAKSQSRFLVQAAAVQVRGESCAMYHLEQPRASASVSAQVELVALPHLALRLRLAAVISRPVALEVVVQQQQQAHLSRGQAVVVESQALGITPVPHLAHPQGVRLAR